MAKELVIWLNQAETESLLQALKDDLSIIIKLNDNKYNFPNNLYGIIGVQEHGNNDSESDLEIEAIPLNPFDLDHYRLAIVTYEVGLEESEAPPSV